MNLLVLQLTYADILFACLLDMMSMMASQEFKTNVPQMVLDYKNSVMGNPSIKKWVEKRPKTPF